MAVPVNKEIYFILVFGVTVFSPFVGYHSVNRVICLTVSFLSIVGNGGVSLVSDSAVS